MGLKPFVCKHTPFVHQGGHDGALALCQSIVSKSPIATLGIKEFLNYRRDNSVKDSLEYAITWNMSMLQGSDLAIATVSIVQKCLPEYENLPGTQPSKLSKLSFSTRP
ncbi:unnamed protein product [Durusdinium trenchii]|uniref:Uncharacterized protein n=1 Tax=Durusdinium trenchii TaxID=1381693 RepID=A0ABP0L7B9_9DINO